MGGTRERSVPTVVPIVSADPRAPRPAPRFATNEKEWPSSPLGACVAPAHGYRAKQYVFSWKKLG